MRRRDLVIVALISSSLIALELAWTRIFSAEFFYTFAFLILSIAILGLGLGALALRLFPSLGRPERLGLILSLTGLMTLIGPPAVFELGLKFSALLNSWGILDMSNGVIQWHHIACNGFGIMRDLCRPTGSILPPCIGWKSIFINSNRFDSS